MINTSDDVIIIEQIMTTTEMDSLPSQLENTSLRDIERRDGYEDIENVGIRENIEKSDEYKKFERNFLE